MKNKHILLIMFPQHTSHSEFVVKGMSCFLFFYLITKINLLYTSLRVTLTATFFYIEPCCIAELERVRLVAVIKIGSKYDQILWWGRLSVGIWLSQASSTKQA